MQESKKFTIFLNSKAFEIPCDFKYLEDVDPNILEALKTKGKYYIKSIVQDETLNSFIDYWISRKNPEINNLNIMEYYQLSEEFDLMKNHILLFQTYITKDYHSFFYNQNTTTKIKLQEKTRILQQNKDDYHQIIKILFNTNNYMHQKSNNELVDACHQNNIKFFLISNSIKIDEDGVLYSIDEKEKTANVLRKTDTRNTIFIPKSIKYQNKEYKITHIFENAFQNDQNIKKIEFPNDSEILTIGDNSFENSALESITIPSRVIEIGENSFANCLQLTNVEFMKDIKLKSIKKMAFSPISIESIDIPYVENIDEFAFMCPNLKNVTIRNMVKTHPMSFYESPITNLTIPSDIESLLFIEIPADIQINIIKKERENVILYDNKYILRKSDQNCDEYDDLIFAMPNIVREEIPYFIKKISYGAFANCKSIETVTFPENSRLEIINGYAFANSSIKSIIIPPHVKKIGPYSFSSCNQLETVEFSKQSELEMILEYAFYNSSIHSIFSLPSRAMIKDACFSETPNLKTITIEHNGEENISFIDDKCLIGKSNKNAKDFDALYFAIHDIESVKIPDSIEYIAPRCFYKSQVKNIEFTSNSSIKIIGELAFSYSQIETITIPSHVTVIGKYAFSSCEQLAEINFEENSELRIICESAFFQTAINSFNIPPHVLEIGQAVFFNCQHIREVRCTANSELKFMDEHVFLSSSIETLSIPSGINIQNCFSSEAHLINITVFPTSQKNVIFKNNLLIGKSDPSKDIYDILLLAPKNIKSAKIPSFIKKIHQSAFRKCTELKTVIFEDNSQLQIIDSFAFSESGIEIISLPDSVTLIEEGAFCSCSRLKYLIISPNSKLTSIGNYAFESSSIEKILIPRNTHQIGEMCFSKCENLRIVDFDSDSELHTIHQSAFSQTAILSFQAPKKLYRIEKRSFAFCNDLKLVEIDDDSRLAVINEEAFICLRSTIFFIDKKAMKLFDKVSF